MGIKKFLAIFLATASLASSAMGITAGAERLNYYFSFNGKGGSGWSSGNEKDDNEQAAYIHTVNGYLTSTSYQLFTLYKQQNATAANKISNTYTINSVGRTYYIPYTKYRGTGSISYIRSNGTYNGSTASGYWYA